MEVDGALWLLCGYSIGLSFRFVSPEGICFCFLLYGLLFWVGGLVGARRPNPSLILGGAVL